MGEFLGNLNMNEDELGEDDCLDKKVIKINYEKYYKNWKKWGQKRWEKRETLRPYYNHLQSEESVNASQIPQQNKGKKSLKLS